MSEVNARERAASLQSSRGICGPKSRIKSITNLCSMRGLGEGLQKETALKYNLSFGRGFDEHIKRGADEYGITYVRARPGEVTEDPVTKNLFVWYDDTEAGGVKKMEFDMVVLSTAFVPPPGIEKLAEVLGVEMDVYKFFKAADDLLAPMDTNEPGIYIAGACTRPMDVTDAVTQGGGAADRAAQAIWEFTGKPAAKAAARR